MQPYCQRAPRFDETRATCPNCGAPLAVAENQALALCLYCDTVVRLAASLATQPDFDRAATVAPETVRKIKQYLLLGRRGDAIRLYQQATGVAEAQAATAVLAFSRQIALGVARSQQLNLRGGSHSFCWRLGWWRSSLRA